MANKFDYQVIWQGTGIEVFRKNKQRVSISFEFHSIRQAISGLNLIRGCSSGSEFRAGGTIGIRTSKTIRLEDYQGRNLSLYPKDFGDFINILYTALSAKEGL